MRALIFIAGAALTLGACSDNDQAENTQNVDESLTAESIVANDITAIDAVTADAANMAADVDINFTSEQLTGSGTNAADPRSTRPQPRSPSREPGTTPPRSRTPTPAPPASNATDNATE